MVGQADDAGAEFDVAGALGGGGDEDFGGGDGFPAGAVVLADPGFVVAELVEQLDQLEVALEGEGGVLAEPVEGARKMPNFIRMVGGLLVGAVRILRGGAVGQRWLASTIGVG